MTGLYSPDVLTRLKPNDFQIICLRLHFSDLSASPVLYLQLAQKCLTSFCLKGISSVVLLLYTIYLQLKTKGWMNNGHINLFYISFQGWCKQPKFTCSSFIFDQCYSKFLSLLYFLVPSPSHFPITTTYSFSYSDLPGHILKIRKFCQSSLPVDTFPELPSRNFQDYLC